MNKRPRLDLEEHLIDLAKSGQWAKLDEALQLSSKIEDAVASKVFLECVATMSRNNEKFDQRRAEFLAELQRP